MRLLLLCLLAGTVLGQNLDDVNIENIDMEQPNDADLVEPEKTVETRAINEAGADKDGDGKFHVYVGTIDGVRREVFNEVTGGEDTIPSDSVGNGRVPDPFGAYDDNSVVSQNDEKGIFIPRPYRPKEERDKDTTTERPTTTRAPTTRFTQPPTTQPRPVPTAPPRPAPPPVRLPQPLPPQPPQPTFQRPPQQTFQPQPLPQAPPQPPRVPQFQTQRTRRPPFAPVQQTPAPQPPLQPFRPQPQQPQQSSFRQPQPQQNTFQQPQRGFQQGFQQGFRQPQPQPQTRPPPQPQTRPPPPPTTPAPRPPFNGGGNPANLRNGVCSASIFYISTPISGPSRLSFTHFAIAVTVDQCARTCHEFNCAIAHYNPINGHCEFNPSTAFAIRNGQCPAWPSLHYRNNAVASEPVRIFCVTCQRPRRRDPSRARNRFQLRQRVFDPRQQGQQRNGFRRPRKSSSSRVTDDIVSVPVIHGVLLRQPTARAAGLSTSSFVSLSHNEPAKARSSLTAQVPEIALESVGAAQPVEVSPVEMEEGDAIGLKNRASGVVTHKSSEPLSLDTEEVFDDEQ